MERFGSDKPDLRFAMELVDLGAALGGRRRPGFRVFDDALASGGRVKAIVVPGMGGATRKEIDELTERAKRFGAKGLVWLAVDETGAVRSSIGEVPRRRRSRAARGACRREPGRPRPRRRRRSRASPPTSSAGSGPSSASASAWPDPEVLSFCWVHRFPMYQWDAEGGRWDATHNPFSGVVPEDEELLTTASGDPSRARSRAIRPAAPGRSSTTSS